MRRYAKKRKHKKQQELGRYEHGQQGTQGINWDVWSSDRVEVKEGRPEEFLQHFFQKTDKLQYQGDKELWRSSDARTRPEGTRVLFWLQEQPRGLERRVIKFRSQQVNTGHKSKEVDWTRSKANFKYEQYIRHIWGEMHLGDKVSAEGQLGLPQEFKTFNSLWLMK